ncbi:glycoside hydrolase superfamily [Scheffersomyces coipomensis]|uniref:glycoside hydrolase superfamily n=1 Tax=Scheffersomyces coipomensis TaxID=1788519 RepID=UPI00315DBCCC
MNLVFLFFRLVVILSFYINCIRAAIYSNNSIIQSQYNSNNFQYKGIALGGWLVLEPYITPSLFLAFNSTSNTTAADIPVDEYHYCQYLGEDEALIRLTQHWDTFYNETDFELIKQYGLNMVRIPIGYWAFQKLDDDPYVMGAQDYLDKALEWAKNNDLKVWIDLHGTPGSQNGFDNSGFRDIGYPGWFNKTEYLNVTYQVLNEIYDKYGTGDYALEYNDTILGIEVVNEPYTPSLNMTKLLQFYKQTYVDAREIQTLNNTIVFQDGFQPIGYYDYFMDSGSIYTNSSQFQNQTKASNQTGIELYNILIDHHHYEVFGSVVDSNITVHLENIKNYAQSIDNELTSHPAVVGEWSAALTDCTPWLNGVGLGSRYAGQPPYNMTKIGSCAQINNYAKWTDRQKVNTRKFIEMQIDQYNRYSNGWIFWCFKTETTIEWDFQRLVEFDLMPQPLDNFTYIVNGTDTDPSASIAVSTTGSISFIITIMAFIIGLSLIL